MPITYVDAGPAAKKSAITYIDPPAKPRAGRSNDDVRAGGDYQAVRADRVADRAKLREQQQRNPIARFLPDMQPETAGLSNMAMPLPLGDEFAGGIEALTQVGRNIIPGGPKRSVRAAYLAGKDDEQARLDRRRAKNPVASMGLEVASSLGGAAPARLAATAATRVAPIVRAGRVAKTVAKGAAGGGLAAAAYGAADSEGLEGRAKNAGRSAVAGAAVGGGLTAATMAAAPVVSRAVRGVRGGLTDAVRGLTTAAPDPHAPRVPTARHVSAADEEFERILAEGGISSPGDVAQVQAQRAGVELTAAEIAGRNGTGRVRALSSRPGATGDAAVDLAQQRRVGTPEAIIGDAREVLGVDPAGARGDMQAQTEQARKRVKPLWDEALGDEAPLSSPELDELWGNPLVQENIASAERLARMERESAYGQSVDDMLVGDGLPGGPQPIGGEAPPPLARSERVALGDVRAQRAPKAGNGPTLMQFLAKRGGVADGGGELGAMDAGQWHKGKPFQPRVTGGAAPLDEEAAAMAAYEAGYFPDVPPPVMDGSGNMTPVSAQQLRDAIRDELAGRPRYARQGDASRGAAADDMEGQLHALGLDASATDDDVARAMADRDGWGDMPEYGAAPPPETEPVFGEKPTTKTWDYIRRAINADIGKRYRNGFGKLDLDEVGRVEVGVAGRVTKGMRRANPKLARALDESGDYLQDQEAFDLMRGKLLRGTTADFGKVWAGAKTPAQKAAARAAAAADLHEAYESGLLKSGRLSVPGMQAKLELMFGRDQARTFIQRAESRGQALAASQRMNPNVNSTTGDVIGFGADDAGAAMGLAQNTMQGFRDLGSGAVIQGIGRLTVGNALKAIAYTKSAGVPVEVRDELGRRLLMTADELMDWLRARNQPIAPRRRLDGVGTGRTGGTLTGGQGAYAGATSSD